MTAARQPAAAPPADDLRSGPADFWVRPGRISDLAALVALEQASFPDPWPEGLLRSELERPDRLVLVAVPPGSDRAVGYIAVRQAADEGEILRLAVAPPVRRRLLGRLLVRRSLLVLAARGGRCCFLEVRRGNVAARRLYETHGFRTVGMRPRYYADGADALVYRLDLPGVAGKEGARSAGATGSTEPADSTGSAGADGGGAPDPG